jgi:hypothetical protein
MFRQLSNAQQLGIVGFVLGVITVIVVTALR